MLVERVQQILCVPLCQAANAEPLTQVSLCIVRKPPCLSTSCFRLTAALFQSVVIDIAASLVVYVEQRFHCHGGEVVPPRQRVCSLRPSPSRSRRPRPPTERCRRAAEASVARGRRRRVRPKVADVRTAYVVWSGATDIVRYTEEQLREVEDLAGLLGKAGPGPQCRSSFGLGRWFEARHEQTGEITNQPVRHAAAPGRGHETACSRARRR